MKNNNFQRLVVYLNNLEAKKNFVTTHSYNEIPTAKDAIRVVWTMHSNPSDNTHDMSRKIKKAVYNGKPLLAFLDANPAKNEWIQKIN